MTNDDIVAKMKERMSELEKLYESALEKYENFKSNRDKCVIIDFVFGDYDDFYVNSSIDKNLIMDYYEELLKDRFNDVYKEICYLERLGIPSSRKKLHFNI